MKQDNKPLDLLLREKKNRMSLCVLHIDDNKGSFVQSYDISKVRSENFTSILYDYKKDGTINSEGRELISQILEDISAVNASDQKWEVVQGIEYEEILELLANYKSI